MSFWLNKHSHWVITVENAETFQPNISLPENVTGWPLSESSHVLPSKTEGNVQLSEIKPQPNYKDFRVIDRRKKCTTEKRKTLSFFRGVSVLIDTCGACLTEFLLASINVWTLCCYYLYTLETLINLCFFLRIHITSYIYDNLFAIRFLTG